MKTLFTSVAMDRRTKGHPNLGPTSYDASPPTLCVSNNSAHAATHLLPITFQLAYGLARIGNPLYDRRVHRKKTPNIHAHIRVFHSLI